MTVQELINELQKYDKNLGIRIIDEFGRLVWLDDFDMIVGEYEEDNVKDYLLIRL